jgi:hypothetical protein
MCCSRDALRAGLAGLLWSHTGHTRDRVGYKGDIVHLDLLGGGLTTLIHIDAGSNIEALHPPSQQLESAALLGSDLDS